MPKIVDRAEMQDGILDAAMKVYASKGYHAATIADVAKAAELGKGTLYLYFQNKEAIALAMVDRHFKGMKESFIRADAPKSLAEFSRDLDQTMNVPDEHARFVRVFFEVFGPSFASDEFSQKVASFFDELGAHYASQIKALVDRGEIRNDVEPKNLGRALASLVDGMILHKGLFSVKKGQYQSMRRAALSMFLEGLTPAPKD